MSKFQYEGAMRHGLRSQRCLLGDTWADADKFAAAVVSAALARIGAIRPTWEQAQPDYAQPGVVPIYRMFCARCAKPLSYPQRYYCSVDCGIAHTTARYHAAHRDERNAVRRAQAAAWSAAQPERPCPVCGTLFRPRDSRQTLCSKRCATVRASAARKINAEASTVT